MIVKFGIAGPGGIARVHARALKEIPEAELVGVYGHRKESSCKFAEEFGIPWYTDLDEFISDTNLDAVSICTPHHVRSELAIPIAHARKHILIEKPLAISLEEADKIIGVCRDSNVKLGVIFQSRFADDVQRLKWAIDEGRLGKLMLISGYVKWYRAPEYYNNRWHGKLSTEGGGALINQAIHIIDLIRWIGGEVESVVAFIDHLLHDIEVEDVAEMLLKFSSGALGSIEAGTALYPGYPMRLEVHTTMGTVTLEENEITNADLKIPGLSHGLFPHIGRRSTITGSFDPLAVDVLLHKRQISDFINAIVNDETPMVDGIEGRKSLELVIKAYESAKESEIEHLTR